MKINYRCSINPSDNDIKILEKFNVNLKKGFQVFLINKENIFFDEITTFLTERKKSIVPVTTFTKKEIEIAKYANIFSKNHLCYPQPESNFTEVVYNSFNKCEYCISSNHTQVSDFMINKTPKWSNTRKSYQLYWVNDEIFFEKDFYLAFLKKLGIECRNVLDFKTKKPLANIVQIVIPVINQKLVGLDDLKIKKLKCSKCNFVGYEPIVEGFYPSYKADLKINKHIFKTKELFGSGEYYAANIIISSELKNIFLENKINIDFMPTHPDGARMSD